MARWQNSSMAKTAQPTRNFDFKKIFPWILVVIGVLGLFAALMLSIEKIELLKNPNYQASCNINPLFSCTGVMKSSQAAVAGFPNPYFGLVAYALVLCTGVGLLAGAKFKKWYWQLFQLGPMAGVVFAHWLIYQSLYNIGSLCLYCMLVWTITIPAFIYTTLWNLREGNITPPKALKGVASFFDRHHTDILIVWYIAIIALVLNRFWYFFAG